MRQALTALAASLALLASVSATSCSHLSDCSGHGQCVSSNGRFVCQCYDTYGSATDIATYKSPDCSKRECGWRRVVYIMLLC
jgi:hypothetical protein